MIPRASRRAFVCALLGLTAAWSLSCEKVPLLAPSGSTITLTAATNALPANGSAQIVAQVLEAAGTPPHSGTHVIFTTTLGKVEPSEAKTDVNGRVTVTFIAGGINGTARITASSGGATSGTDGAITIAVGTAAVGRVTLTANPSTISSNGGVSTITANVADINANPLSGAPVNFATDAGALSAAVVNTDANGVAQTSLTTAVEATVTATVGVQASGDDGNGNGGQASASVTVDVNPVPDVSITGPGGTNTAGSPITFTIDASPGPDSIAQITKVVVSFGDGSAVDLGAVSGDDITVQHTYDDDGTFTVRVTVTDTLGGVTSAATIIVVLPQPPLSVAVDHTQVASGGNTTVTFSATVTPATATIASYQWDFGDGSPLQTTTSNQVVHTYVTGSGPKTVEVTVTTTTGQQASTQTAVNP
jgi:PKD repeat protein